MCQVICIHQEGLITLKDEEDEEDKHEENEDKEKDNDGPSSRGGLPYARSFVFIRRGLAVRSRTDHTQHCTLNTHWSH